MTGILQAISNFFSAIAGYFGWAKSRSDANNQPDIKRAATGQSEIDAQNEIERAIEKRDLDQLRKHCAE